MSDSLKFAVLLKPKDKQPALDRAAQYVKVDPRIKVVAIRVITDAPSEDHEQITLRERANFEQFRRHYSTLENFELKVVFNPNIPEGFLRACNDEKVNLAIISANSRNKLKDLFVSTIDSTIMRQSNVPLLVVKDASKTTTLGQNVLLAIDFTEVSHLEKLDDYLYESASLFAKSFEGKLHVVSCIEQRNSGTMGGNLDEPRISTLDAGLNIQKLARQLAEEYSKKHNIPKEYIHIQQGRLDEEIPRLCEYLDARMVCMGATPRSSLFGTLNSSASELVLEQIRGDVFIVNTNAL